MIYFNKIKNKLLKLYQKKKHNLLRHFQIKN